MKANASQEKSLAWIVADRALMRGSGIVKSTRGKLRRVFCMQDGEIVFAASNLIEEQLGERLVQAGALLPSLRASAVQEAGRTKRKLAQVLKDAKVMTDEELRRGMEELVEHLLSSTLEWTEGTCELEVGRPSLEGEVTVRMSPVQLILRHARRYPIHLDAVRMRIGPPDVRPQIVPERATLVGSMGTNPVFAFLLEGCDGTLTVPELVARSPGTEEDTLRALHALILLGVLLAAREKMVYQQAAQGPPLGREECLAILARSEGGDFYGILGLTRQTGPLEIRDSYYALARRYHPDRFRAGPLNDLLPRMEQYFTKVTEAYNTLFSPDLRAEYDRLSEAPVAGEGEAKQSETSYLAKQNYLRGKALLEKKRYADAVTFLQNAVRLDSNQAAYHLDLGLVLLRNRRRRADAERELIRAAEIEPTNVMPYLILGQTYQRAGRLAHAARMYREVLRWEPDHAEASALMSEVSGQEEVAEADFLRGVFGD